MKLKTIILFAAGIAFASTMVEMVTITLAIIFLKDTVTKLQLLGVITAIAGIIVTTL